MLQPLLVVMMERYEFGLSIPFYYIICSVILNTLHVGGSGLGTDGGTRKSTMYFIRTGTLPRAEFLKPEAEARASSFSRSGDRRAEAAEYGQTCLKKPVKKPSIHIGF